MCTAKKKNAARPHLPVSMATDAWPMMTAAAY